MVELFLLFDFCPPWSSGCLCKLYIAWDLCWVFVCLVGFPLMGKAEWGDNPVCWWLGLYFCFVCYLDEVSCSGCYWWLDDAGSCITVVSFVWVLTIWYPLGLVPWKIPWTEEPGRLQSIGSWRVRHYWVTSLSLFTFMYWRRKWQLTTVFLPGESQGQQSLMGCHLWGRTELDTTEAT